MRTMLGVLSVVGLVFAGVALAPVARGQSSQTAVCTHVALLSMDGTEAAARIDAAMNAHLTAGRERVTVLTTAPVPGVMVCAY